MKNPRGLEGISDWLFWTQIIIKALSLLLFLSEASILSKQATPLIES